MKVDQPIPRNRFSAKGWQKLCDKVARRTNRDDAEDLVHDAWIRLEEQKVLARNPTALLMRAATNRGIDAFRKEQRNKSLIASEFDVETATNDIPLQDELLIRQDWTKRMYLGLTKMNTRTRQVLLMHRRDGMKYREIAEELSISQSAVEKHMARAKVYLHQWMADW